MAIGLGASSGNRIMESAAGQRLRLPTIDALIAARAVSRDWITHDYKGDLDINEGTLPGLGENPIWDVVLGADGDANLNIANGGALRLDTEATDADQVVLSTDQATSIFGTANFWDTDLESGFYATVRLDTAANSLHNVRIFMGLKVTSTDVLVTDADQAMWHMDANALTTPQPWSTVTSNNGQDVIRLYSNAEESTVVGLGVLLDRSRRPHYFFNGNWVGTGAALRSLTTLEPFIGVASRGQAEQKILDIRNMWICQRYEQS